MLTAQPTQPPHQKYLGSRGLIALLALLSAFVPLSTDMYLPALPTMSRNLQAPIEQINLTLTAFFVLFSIGMLVWGPLSDRYGRKPILLIGLSLYVIASGACSITDSVTALIVFRALQALGGSASGAVASAIVKDTFSGRQRETVLAIVQSMVMISPAVAPMLGAALLNFTSWRGVFWVLTAVGVVALACALLLQETLQQRTTGALLATYARLGTVVQNRGFTLLMLLFSLGGLSGLAFVSASTYIYQDGFGLSGQAYSFYFGLNAVCLIAGPALYMRLSRRVHPETIIRAGFLVSLASGVLVVLLGNLAPYAFALAILPSSIAGSIIRPPSTNLMLEQQSGDTGSMVSVIGCVGLLMGSLGMTLISLPWGNTIVALGSMIILTSGISLFAWPLVIRQAVRLPHAPTGERELEPSSL
ncbi:MAG TPA: multidrug effflux MFS transporter [Anaerolineales bacterium]|nr:multidrug effflux MFS transporter [Anaerolineales bacterium]